MTSRRAASGNGFYTIWCVALCLFVLASVPVLATSRRQLTDSTVIAKSTGAAALKPEGVRVPLELVPAERRNNQSLAARIAKLPIDKSFYLVFRNLSTAEQPGEIYHVYINLPEGKTPTRADTPVGVINFYNFGPEWQGKDRPDVYFSFDVTQLLRNLVDEKRLAEPLMITIVPAERPAKNVTPTVGQIELVEQRTLPV